MKKIQDIIKQWNHSDYIEKVEMLSGYAGPFTVYGSDKPVACWWHELPTQVQSFLLSKYSKEPAGAAAIGKNQILVTQAGRLQLVTEYKARIAVCISKQMCDQMPEDKFAGYVKALSRENLEQLAVVLHKERQQLADAVLGVK